MEELLEHLRSISTLSDTGLEAMEYLSKQLEEAKENPPLYLITDIIDAYLSMENSVHMLEEKIDMGEVNKLSDILDKELYASLSAVQAEDIQGLEQVLKLYALPAYKQWREELLKQISPFTIS